RHIPQGGYMPALSKPHPPVAVEGFDLTHMSHLNEHPALAALLSEKATLRQQLATIAGEVRGLRQQLYDLSGDEDFTVATNRRRLQNQITEREREGAAIEEQLQHLATEI